MTEGDWRDCCDPEAMLRLLHDQAGRFPSCSCSCCRVRCRQQVGSCAAYRKLRLFACGCCHRVLHLFSDPVCPQVVRSLEDYIDGMVDQTVYDQIGTEFDQTRRKRFPKFATSDDGAWNALYCAVHRRWADTFDDRYAEDRWRIALVVAKDAASAIGSSETQAQCHLLRDLFGNPSGPIVVHPSWLTPEIVRLAESMYAERPFDWLPMPLLADSLEDAGCTNADILSHCRQPGPHVRGCWVVDLILDAASNCRNDQPTTQEPETASPWLFDAPEKQKGRVFIYFYHRDSEDTDVGLVVTVLQEKLQAKLISTIAGPYCDLYEFSVREMSMTLIDDNWPSPYLSAPEKDEQAFLELVDKLRQELS